MFEYLKPVLAEKGPDLSMDERNLFSVACKNLLSQKRSARRTLITIEGNQKYGKYKSSLKELKDKLETGLLQDCENIVELVKTFVLAKANQDE
jgi:hypothetical protein